MLKTGQNPYASKLYSMLSLLLALFYGGCGGSESISRFRCDLRKTYYDGMMCLPYKSPGDQCDNAIIYDPAAPRNYMCGYKDEPEVLFSISPVFYVPEGLQLSQFVAPMCVVYPLKLVAGDSYQTFGASFVLRLGRVARVSQGEKVVAQEIDPYTGVVLDETFTTEVTVLAYDCGMSIPPEKLVFLGIVFARGYRVPVRQSGKVPGKNGNPDTVYVVDRSGSPITIDGKSFSGGVVSLTKFGS